MSQPFASAVRSLIVRCAAMPGAESFGGPTRES
jgi:hypothetical protein